MGGEMRRQVGGELRWAVKRLMVVFAIVSTLGCSAIMATNTYDVLDGAGRDLEAFSTGLRQAARYWCNWFGDGAESGYLAEVEKVLDRADEKIAAWNGGVREHELELRLLLDWAERAVNGIAGHAREGL
jgi:hypothetical protein